MTGTKKFLELLDIPILLPLALDSRRSSAVHLEQEALDPTDNDLPAATAKAVAERDPRVRARAANVAVLVEKGVASPADQLLGMYAGVGKRVANA